MADKRFSNKVVGEDTGYSFRESDASFRGDNLGVQKSDLVRGSSEPKKFKVEQDDKFARLPTGHDRA